MKSLEFDVPVAELSKYVDPMSGWLWGCAPISIEDVQVAVEKGEFEQRAWDKVGSELRGTPQAQDFHVRRIAYFVKNGYSTDDRAILLDVSVQGDGNRIGIANGNHRIAAAIIREDEMLRVLAHVEDTTDLTALVPGAALVQPSSAAP